MNSYIHRLPDWPRFVWNHERIAAHLASARHTQGRLTGQAEALGHKVQEEAVLRTLTDDVLETTEIEGEHLDAEQVRYSVARRLGIYVGGLTPADRDVEGAVEMVLDATQRFDEPVTEERLFGWHAALFPNARSGTQPITVGVWRDDRTGPTQITSGPVGRERVHFVAPDAARVPEEMRRFLEWFNGHTTMEQVLNAAVAHLWFVTIHPFDDGNGRIARAIADMALCRSEPGAPRCYSISTQMRQERSDYYRVLEETQQGTLDVTLWMEWFLGCLTRAIEAAHRALAGVVANARYWETLRAVSLNDRQRLMINRLLGGFEGKLTSSKWAALTDSSQDTALRDIQQLVERGVLIRHTSGGRSTSYALAPIR